MGCAQTPSGVPSRVNCACFPAKLGCGFRNPKVDDTRRRAAIEFHYNNIGRLQVAVNNRLLMRMLHSVTHEVEEFQTFPDTQSQRSAGHGSSVISQRYLHPAQARLDAAIPLLE
jgi:hypothetical protein